MKFTSLIFLPLFVAANIKYPRDFRSYMTRYVLDIQTELYNGCIDIETELYTKVRENTIGLISRQERDYGFFQYINSIKPEQLCRGFTSLELYTKDAIFYCTKPNSLHYYYNLRYMLPTNNTTPYSYIFDTRQMPKNVSDAILPKPILDRYMMRYREFNTTFSVSIEKLMDKFIDFEISIDDL